MSQSRPRLACLAVLLSGSGRTLRNLLEKIADRSIEASVGFVVSSRPGVRGLEIAEEAGIPFAVVQRKSFETDLEFSEEIYRTIGQALPDLIICAGFLKRLVVTPKWENRILNIHPALIPESRAAGLGFYGDRVHEAVIASGASLSGATVHVVDNEYDHGRIVMKEFVPILGGDTPTELSARVFALECDLYPRAIAQYIALNPGLIM